MVRNRSRPSHHERGDLLVAANGGSLSSVDELFDALDASGDLTLGVVRGTDEHELVVHFSS